jgi:hypothetical protein
VGRAIRYGGDPINPQAQIRAGQQVFSRVQAVAYLIELGNAIDQFELLRGTLMTMKDVGRAMSRLADYLGQSPVAQDERVISDLPEHERAGPMALMAGLSLVSPESQEPEDDPAHATVAYLVGVMGPALAALGEENSMMLDQLVSQEQSLRVTLQLIASASPEGE